MRAVGMVVLALSATATPSGDLLELQPNKCAYPMGMAGLADRLLLWPEVALGPDRPWALTGPVSLLFFAFFLSFCFFC